MSRRKAPTPRRGAAEGYTVALCRAETGCGAADDGVVEAIRTAVRQSPHGVLVSTGCLARYLHCPHHAGNRVPRTGVRLVVQPCTRERTPVGAAVTFGPLTDVAHGQDLAAWLTHGLRQGRRPPRHLLAVRPSSPATPGTAPHPGSHG